MTAMDDDPAVRACTRCGDLVANRMQIVNGRGDREADLAIVGEAPGSQEDLEGEPFVGRSGAILEESLGDLGVDPSHVRITNLIRCRPPENRDPYVAERENCFPYLEYELRLVDPAVVIALGRIPAQALIDPSMLVTDRVGEVVPVHLGGRERQAVVGLHPAATLYDRSKQAAFEGALERAVDLAGCG